MVAVSELQFAIMSPDMLGGSRADFPSIRLSNAYLPESSNVYPRYGEIHRMKGRQPDLLDNAGDAVATPDANPIIKYHTHYTIAGEQRFFGATTRNIYIWDTATKAWSLRYNASADTEHWSLVSFSGKVLATNGIDVVKFWDEDSPATLFASLGSDNGLDLDGTGTYLTSAKYLGTYENYVFVGYTVEAGVTLPFRGRWCSLGDETDWDETGGGDTGAKDFLSGDQNSQDFLKGFGTEGTEFQYMIVFKDRSIHRGWLVTEDTVFNWAPKFSNVGLLATDSVVKDKNSRVYFLASDRKIRELTSGIISQGIDPIVRDIHPTLAEFASATYIDELDLVWFSVPIGDDATGNNRIFSLKPDGGDEDPLSWSVMTFPVRAFGDFSRQDVYTIDTIPFDTIDTIGWPTIDTVENVVGFPLDMASDYSGFSYSLHANENDAGAAFTGSAVISTDLAEKVGLGFFKRISFIQLYFRSEGSGTVLIEFKRDDEANWQSLDSVSLTDTADIIRREVYPDIRARNYKFRFSATNAFRLIGMIFRYEPDGER